MEWTFLHDSDPRIEQKERISNVQTIRSRVLQANTMSRGGRAAAEKFVLDTTGPWFCRSSPSTEAEEEMMEYDEHAALLPGAGADFHGNASPPPSWGTFLDTDIDSYFDAPPLVPATALSAPQNTFNNVHGT